MGNILTQKRHKQNGTQIEDMTYRYQRDANGFLLSNRLYHVNDAIASTIDQTDIDDQGAGFNPLNVNINGAYNYVYDEEGRLVKDVTEGIHQIVWRVDGKVREINRTSTSTRSRLKFDYDAMGRRIAKHVYNNQTGLLIKSTYYLLDAQGNTMSTYDYAPGPNQTMSYQLKERHIFGSARLGMDAESVLLVENPSTENTNVLVNQGFKQYEMTNHLGNVLTVIHDIKIPLNNGSVPGVSSYRVGIRTCSDYSPFGVELDSRTVSGGYRYGYQRQESDDEVKGDGNTVNYTFRMHDTRLGRFLTVDPLTKSFPYLSSYQFSANSPIQFIELEGKQPTYPMTLEDWVKFTKSMYSKEIISKNESIVESINSFSQNDAQTLFDFFELNSSVWHELEGTKFQKGNQFTTEKCAFDCITVAAQGVRLLNDNFKIPINGGKNGNMRVYMNNIAKKDYAGEEFKTEIKRNIFGNSKMDKSLGKKIEEESKGEKGFHFFTIAINGGVHSALIGIKVNDNKKVESYYFLDQISGKKEFSSRKEFDNIVKGWSNRLDYKEDGIYTRKLINTKVKKNV